MAKTTPEQRDRIVTMITDSYVNHPRQKADFVASESKRIAVRIFGRKDAETNLGRIAAVRANYTMGRYGRPETLRRKRREELKKLVSS